jgi:hypothetical protein
MRSRKYALAFSFAIAALFLSAVIIQPLSLVGPARAQIQIEQPAELAETRREGYRVPVLSVRDESVEVSSEVPSSEVWNLEIAQGHENGLALEESRFIRLLPGGLDHIANGVGTRNAGFGTIRLRGAPAGSVLVAAYLYWGTIYPTNAVPATAAIGFNSNSITGQIIGPATTEPCWNASGSFAAYRADVRSFITAGINNDYVVKNMPSAVTNGSTPWCPFNNTLPLSEGASLLVIYSHANVPTSAQIEIAHGPKEFDNVTLDVPHLMNLPVPSHNALKHTRILADGQVGFSFPGCGLKSFAPLTNEKTSIGPAGGPFLQFKGVGATANQDSDFNGYDGDPLNKLWDTHTDDVTGAVGSGATDYTIRYFAGNDCVVWVVHVLGAR